MSEKNKSKNDHLPDFLRYKQNKMTDRERNAFERRLQKDPFGEEASEGFEGIDPELAAKDVSELRKRVNRRTSENRRVIWYRIAASVAVLTILSAIFIITDKRKVPEQLAYSPAEQQKEEIQILKEEPVTEKYEYAAFPVEEKQPTAVIPEKSTRAPLIKAENEKQEAIITANVAKPDQAVASEKAIPAKTAITRKPSGTGMETRTDSAAVAQDEIVVVGYGVRGAGDEAEEAVNEYTPPRPVNGRADFDKYIRDNIRRPDTTTAGQRVVVVLNFSVNPDGKIDSIKVVRSPGKIFSDEAIRLLKDGPEWKPAEENGTTVSDEVRIRIVFK